MVSFLLTPRGVLYLIAMLFPLVLFAYLLSIKIKSKATWLLIGNVLGHILNLVGWTIGEVVYAQSLQALTWVTRVEVFLGSGMYVVGGVCFVLFAYRFLDHPFKQEERIARWGLGLATCFLLINIIMELLAYRALFEMGAVVEMAPLILWLWATVVFARKAWHWRRDIVRFYACRSFTGIGGLMILSSVLSVLIWVFNFPGLFPVFLFTLVFSFFWMLIVLVNQSPQFATLQIKLVALFSFLAVGVFLVIVGIIFTPSSLLKESGITPPYNESLRFTPDSGDRYKMLQLPTDFDSDFGLAVEVNANEARVVELPFTFLFFGTSYDHFRLTTYGVIHFVRFKYWNFILTTPRKVMYFELPLITPLYANLDRSEGQVFLKSEATKVTVTWFEIPQGNRTDKLTMQAVLHADGRIDFNYPRAPQVFYASQAVNFEGGRGIRSGRYPTDQDWLEDYSLAYSQYSHAKMTPIAWLIGGMICFILFVTPLFFQAGLIVPLQTLLAGIKRVQEGNLEVEVPVQLQDEIGVVTRHFNEMTSAVRQHAEELEQRVEARTQDLKETNMALEAENRRKTAELEEARTLQLAMLPDRPPQLPDLEVAFFMRTATEVGGDYYDFHINDQGVLTLVLGDAAGHGMQAGLIVATTKSYFQSLVQAGVPSPQILQRISKSLSALRQRGMYMALSLLTYQDATLSYVSAGMPPALVYRKETGKTVTVQPKGLPLGMKAEVVYEEVNVPLSPGDVVLLMSDGLPELFNPNLAVLGLEPVKACLAERAGENPEALIADLQALAVAWAGSRPHEDDITLMVLKAM